MHGPDYLGKPQKATKGQIAIGNYLVKCFGKDQCCKKPLSLPNEILG